MKRVLVAGVGNIFLKDDAFGVETIRHMIGTEQPEGVDVVDFGIRGVHLAYQLLDGYDTLIIVDAVPREGEAPGTVFVLEPDIEKPTSEVEEAVEAGAMPLVDSHGMEPGSMLAMLGMLGGTVEKVLVLGCAPADVTEGIGLSPEVEAAVPVAVEMLQEVIDEEAGSLTTGPARKEL